MRSSNFTFYLSTEQRSILSALPQVPWMSVVNTLLSHLASVEFRQPMSIPEFAQDLHWRLGLQLTNAVQVQQFQAGLLEFQEDFLRLHRSLQLGESIRMNMQLVKLTSKDYIVEIRSQVKSSATYPTTLDFANVRIH